MFFSLPIASPSGLVAFEDHSVANTAVYAKYGELWRLDTIGQETAILINEDAIEHNRT